MTDPGRKRRRNEDAFVCEPPLFAVADGMGGAQAGEIASRLAASALQAGNSLPGALDGEERVASLIQEANRRVYQRSSEDESVSGMGTTMTVALVGDGVIAIGHVGDSRAYRLRGGQLEQLTEDHSLVAELLRSGKLSPEEAEHHPQRSVITRALGTEPDVDVDTFSIETRPGDVFMLCSDGLTSMLGDDAILELVERNRDDLQQAGRALVAAANRNGGEDNITVVFFEIAESGEGPSTSAPAAAAPAAGQDDEDTLSGLDPVPAVDTMVVPAEHVDEWLAEQESPEKPAKPGRSPRRRLGVVLAALAALALLSGLALWGVSRAHFVGAEPDGHVAIYQGLPYDIAGGVRLYRVVYASPLLAAQLSQAERRSLFDHDLRGYRSALNILKNLEQDAVP